jgi:hypothetical protein
MGLLRRFWRRLADADHRPAGRDGGLRVYDVLILDAERDALARRVERLEAENRDLRRQLDARGEG